jgi:serralysin
MPSETLFLQPIVDPVLNPNPNFANAQGFAFFSNYSQKPSGTLTSIQGETLVKSGVAEAIIDANATFKSDPTFSLLFGNITGIGFGGSFEGSANVQTKVVASFAVGAKQNFSFNFSADIKLTAKEIENDKTEYNKATSKTSFVVLDTKDINKPTVLDYFGIQGKLISSDQISDFNLGVSSHFTLKNYDKTTDINGNNGEDSLTVKVIGAYRNVFKGNSKITIVQINSSAVEFIGDTLIGNLGEDVIYGTIRNDQLHGSDHADKIYGSFGNDRLDGYKGDDILEGGKGEDLLYGYQGDDKLYGGWDDDLLNGGDGNDVLIGGDGHDEFVFNHNDSLLKDEFDVIKDFQVGTDKIVFQGWGSMNADDWLNQMFSQGKILDTEDGVIFNLNTELNQVTLLLSGVSSSQISSGSVIF